ncbi:helix-turn-helix domain-containing protein [Staphylococcus simulans]|uniref:helix-turn-helix domain-containing protein n=1 Tax=Staphylococcus simulans TaxID=1286 RepID=UPI000D0372FD|nr:helix-turn-helix transcriptional regulator [Staphylococcus simulans]MDN6062818.1 helix-turn-helix transcriptional regulator [Staphylococcus simulans]MDN6205616.1 helix-turn-helix transcriptional regulator [Staphylococcus simulans]MDN6233435.1 helix-turn-helix transcriptional regulator [Staphylococcus simulans]MDN6261041.1 helix-turn-helix transcriptional regulator [Staphylococcus simulans]
MEINKIVAQNIRILMAKEEKTISEVYRDTNIARSSLTDISKGRTKQISFKTLEKLSKYFQVEVYKLFKKDGI